MESLSFIKYGLSSGKALYNTLSSGNIDNKQILDPLSCIIRLALLNFKETGSKISIANNRIYYQSPNLLQGPTRWAYGDNRNDLHNLCSPIERCVLWYDPNNNNDIKEIFEYAVKGLTKLKHSYINDGNNESNLVCHSIIHYIGILNIKLENGTLSIDNNNNNSQINKLKYIWNKDEINVVNTLIKITNEKYEKKQNYESSLNAIESILSGKDYIIGDII